ncbi:MAG: DUF4156 domain-containing protein [Gammaproteobacteria bacterium]|nr:DUF4156 domain-containing protein [Gammaproteobacteria bacterium]
MNKLCFYFAACFGVLIISGCVPRILDPNAEGVYVVPDNETVKECKYLGQINGNNIHGESTYFSSKDNLEKDDINFLRNAGRKLGANVVTFCQHQVIDTPHTSATPKKHYYTESSHDIKGGAYSCSSDIRWQLQRNTIGTHYSY